MNSAIIFSCFILCLSAQCIVGQYPDTAKTFFKILSSQQLTASGSTEDNFEILQLDPGSQQVIVSAEVRRTLDKELAIEVAQSHSNYLVGGLKTQTASKVRNIYIDVNLGAHWENYLYIYCVLDKTETTSGTTPIARIITPSNNGGASYANIPEKGPLEARGRSGSEVGEMTQVKGKNPNPEDYKTLGLQYLAEWQHIQAAWAELEKTHHPRQHAEKTTLLQGIHAMKFDQAFAAYKSLKIFFGK